MSTHNIYFYGELEKIVLELSSNSPHQILCLQIWIQFYLVKGEHIMMGLKKVGVFLMTNFCIFLLLHENWYWHRIHMVDFLPLLQGRQLFWLPVYFPPDWSPCKKASTLFKRIMLPSTDTQIGLILYILLWYATRYLVLVRVHIIPFMPSIP